MIVRFRQKKSKLKRILVKMKQRFVSTVGWWQTIQSIKNGWNFSWIDWFPWNMIRLWMNQMFSRFQCIRIKLSTFNLFMLVRYNRRMLAGAVTLLFTNELSFHIVCNLISNRSIQFLHSLHIHPIRRHHSPFLSVPPEIIFKRLSYTFFDVYRCDLLE